MIEGKRGTNRRRNRRKRLRIWSIALTVMAILMITVIYYELELRPNRDHVDPDWIGQQPIFVSGELTNWEAKGEGEALKIPLGAVQEWIAPHAIYEDTSDSVILTTASKVLQMKTSQLTAIMNDEPIELRFPIEKIENEIYIPVTPLTELYPVQIVETSSGAVLIEEHGKTLIKAGLQSTSEQETAAVRTEPTIKAPILYELSADERMTIWKETESGWYYIQLENGYAGYVEKRGVQLLGTEAIQSAVEQTEYIPWKPVGGKINMTWEHVYSMNPNTDEIGSMSGLNVISPTWFSIGDEEGNVTNKADKSYVNWAHKNGYQVWAMFSNDFTDPDKTSSVLASHETRMNMIRQLMAFIEMYDLQGINLDFENVYLEDKDHLTQFVRELTPFVHEQGAVVSMDVTVHSTSEMWSMFYDREQLGQIIDYMIVMTYDEHWASSPVAGSVASLPWVEKGIVEIIEQDHVPSSKIVMGIPFYTRIWTEQKQDGEIKVSSKAVGMKTIQQLIQEKQLVPVYLEETGQHYIEFEDEEGTKKVWIEDEVSIQNRIEIVQKLDLAGIATWRRGFETSNIWEVIRTSLEKRP